MFSLDFLVQNLVAFYLFAILIIVVGLEVGNKIHQLQMKKIWEREYPALIDGYESTSLASPALTNDQIPPVPGLEGYASFFETEPLSDEQMLLDQGFLLVLSPEEAAKLEDGAVEFQVRERTKDGKVLIGA